MNKRRMYTRQFYRGNWGAFSLALMTLGPVAAAVEKAGLGDLVAREDLDGSCGENGNRLSGGEKHRVSIARSLLRRTQTLRGFFDKLKRLRP